MPDPSLEPDDRCGSASSFAVSSSAFIEGYGVGPREIMASVDIVLVVTLGDRKGVCRVAQEPHRRGGCRYVLGENRPL